MHKSLMLAACLVLGACSSQQSASDVDHATAHSHLEGAQSVPLPLNANTALLKGKAHAQQRFGSSLSNYRVYSIALKKGERYRLNVNSLCDEACKGLNKFDLKPHAMLLDGYGAVLPGKPARPASVIGMTTLGWDGEASEDGTYYLLVAADQEDTGRTVVIDDVWINNSPLMAVKVGRHDTTTAPTPLR